MTQGTDTLSIRGWYVSINHMLGALQHYFFILNPLSLLYYLFLNRKHIHKFWNFKRLKPYTVKILPATFVL